LLALKDFTEDCGSFFCYAAHYKEDAILKATETK